MLIKKRLKIKVYYERLPDMLDEKLKYVERSDN